MGMPSGAIQITTERARQVFGMKTWTFRKYGLCIVVTADNIDLAKDMITNAFYVRRIDGVEINNEDLVPLPTHHRHYRVLNSLKEEV